MRAVTFRCWINKGMISFVVKALWISTGIVCSIPTYVPVLFFFYPNYPLNSVAAIWPFYSSISRHLNTKYMTDQHTNNPRFRCIYGITILYLSATVQQFQVTFIMVLAPQWNTFHWPFQGGFFVMVYFCYSSSLNVCVAYLFLFRIAHLATLWESSCPFRFPLVMFPLGSSYFVFVFLSLWCLWWEVWDNCIGSWSLPSLLF